MEEDLIQINGEITINVDVSVKNVIQKRLCLEPATCNCENGKYLASIINDSVISCHKGIEPYNKKTKTIPTNFHKEKTTCKMQNCYILLAFFIITFSIYCYLIKFQAKQNHFLPFQFTNSKLKGIIY